MITPKAFCINPKKVKAILLGADPTNQQDNKLDYVFGILSSETRYFSGILRNLNQIGLHLEDIYVQNLVQEYQDSETSQNKNWETAASLALPKLIDELTLIRSSVPVLITAERMLKFLLEDKKQLIKAKQIYSNDSLWIVDPKDNKLKRPLIALYRHLDYQLSVQEKYSNLLENYFLEKRALKP